MHVRYTELGENFQENVNQTGYVVDDDRREVDSDLSYRWWIQNNVFRYIEVESRNNVFWASTTGVFRSWNITESVEFYLQNRFSGTTATTMNSSCLRRNITTTGTTLAWATILLNGAMLRPSIPSDRILTVIFRRYSLGGRMKITEKWLCSTAGT